jgi:hypothetical protein
MKKVLGLFLLLSVLSFPLFSQYVEMEWEAHQIGFKVPYDFKILNNNYEEFSAENENLFLTIIPFQDENVDNGDIAEALLTAANDFDYDIVSEVGELELTNLEGYYVNGTKDGVNAVFMFLLDPDTSTNLAVTIVYSDDYFDEAVEVASSFYSEE